jgi:signal transduction histidine kinase
MRRRTAFGLGGPAAWLAVGVCGSVAMLTWFGYRAVRAWEQSSEQLALRRADETANRVALALARDMSAVQKSVLIVADWSVRRSDPPYDLSDIVGGAFARYPYPESFFAQRGALNPSRVVFFSRSNRPPVWTTHQVGAPPSPVLVQSVPSVAELLMNRIRIDVAERRRFSIFEMSVGDRSYQVIAALSYRDQFRQELEGVFGFVVNQAWVREHYFSELIRQVLRIGEADEGLAVAIVDDHGRTITSTQASLASEAISHRPFQLMFFDPLLVALRPPEGQWPGQWAVEVANRSDAARSIAIRGAYQALIGAGLSAAFLAFGFVLTARAVRDSADLAALRSEFVLAVTHGLKTPIATIRAAGATLATGRIRSADEGREYGRIVTQEAKRLTRLVDNLLASSRITDAAKAYSFEALPVGELVESVVQEFRQQLTALQFETRIDIPFDLPSIHADRTAMRLVLDNLIDNAIRYSPTTRSLQISARLAGRYVRLEIRDSGRGIPDDELPRVTQRYYRGRFASLGGSGFGLAIVNRMVADHRGQLIIQSAVNVGTAAIVTLPVSLEDE